MKNLAVIYQKAWKEVQKQVEWKIGRGDLMMNREAREQVTLDNQGSQRVLSFGAGAHMANAGVVEKTLYSNLGMHGVQILYDLRMNATSPQLLEYNSSLAKQLAVAGAGGGSVSGNVNITKGGNAQNQQSGAAPRNVPNITQNGTDRKRITRERDGRRQH